MSKLKRTLFETAKYLDRFEIAKYLNSPAIKDLSNQLTPDEKVVYLTRAIHNDTVGVIALTTSRVVFIQEARFLRDAISIPIEEMVEFNAKRKLFLSNITIETIDGVERFTHIMPRGAIRLRRKFREQAYHQPAFIATPKE